jgi:hypothetical protein
MVTHPSAPPRLLRIVAAGAALFGLATLVSGGRVLFGPEAARAAAGAVVPFVLWFNFGAGFAYLAAAYGLWRGRRWAAPLALGIALATLGVFAAFGLWVAAGAGYEPRTVAALALRSAVWLAVAWLARPRDAARGARQQCARHRNARHQNARGLPALNAPPLEARPGACPPAGARRAASQPGRLGTPARLPGGFGKKVTDRRCAIGYPWGIGPRRTAGGPHR